MNQKQASWALVIITLAFGAAFLWATQEGWGHEPEKRGEDNRQSYGVLLTLFAGSATSLVQMLSAKAKGKQGE